jgi:hypothetical protein
MVCDYCGEKATFDAEAPLTPAQQKEAASWMAILTNGEDGRSDYCKEILRHQWTENRTQAVFNPLD